eukprot:CAMPEP_0172481392 /NCGR_PEP_ID=MMETSP1066-20121228/7196_1 /TAXON_ID=671091 /ORGANISM="Coscinodiscus wailesii, Strain CCMP2513" /LENGTH=546 /DNA_ID=CAMNT_0013243619 /DNA_START=1 /DNA_END=1641 /DNA_ORIENTATION=-
MFVVKNPSILEKNLIPAYFNHSKYSSFSRQLNFYGFTRTCHDAFKIDSTSEESSRHVTFKHKYFIRGRLDLLAKITRSTANGSNNKNITNNTIIAVDSLKTKVSSLSDKVDNLFQSLNAKLKKTSAKANNELEQMSLRASQKIVELEKRTLEESGCYHSKQQNRENKRQNRMSLEAIPLCPSASTRATSNIEEKMSSTDSKALTPTFIDGNTSPANLEYKMSGMPPPPSGVKITTTKPKRTLSIDFVRELMNDYELSKRPSSLILSDVLPMSSEVLWEPVGNCHLSSEPTFKTQNMMGTSTSPETIVVSSTQAGKTYKKYNDKSIITRVSSSTTYSKEKSGNLSSIGGTLSSVITNNNANITPNSMAIPKAPLLCRGSDLTRFISRQQSFMTNGDLFKMDGDDVLQKWSLDFNELPSSFVMQTASPSTDAIIDDRHDDVTDDRNGNDDNHNPVSNLCDGGDDTSSPPSLSVTAGNACAPAPAASTAAHKNLFLDRDYQKQMVVRRRSSIAGSNSLSYRLQQQYGNMTNLCSMSTTKSFSLARERTQ